MSKKSDRETDVPPQMHEPIDFSLLGRYFLASDFKATKTDDPDPTGVYLVTVDEHGIYEKTVIDYFASRRHYEKPIEDLHEKKHALKNSNLRFYVAGSEIRRGKPESRDLPTLIWSPPPSPNQSETSEDSASIDAMWGAAARTWEDVSDRVKGLEELLKRLEARLSGHPAGGEV